MRAEQTAVQSREELVARKNQIIDILDRTIEIFQNDENIDRVDVFRKLKDDFINEEYSIIVVGEFSAGKSTMLNALMGKKILTSFSHETTATVNFLRHKDVAKNGEEGRIFYVDGREEVLDVADSDTIAKYVSTKGNDVAGSIKSVDLYLDSDFLKDGVSIIDSPGLNGLAEGHRKITEDQILKSHACIFLFTAERAGGSKSEFEFLESVQNKVNTVFFVLNKIDVIKASEGESVESVVNILKDNYRKVFSDKDVPEIWPLSAGMALEARDPNGTQSKLSVDELKVLEEKSLMSAFEDRLMQFLVRGEKAKEIFLAPLDRIKAVAGDAREEYIQEIGLLESKKDSSEIEKQIDDLKEAMDEGERKILDKKSEVVSFIKRANKDAINALRTELENLRTKKINEIKSYENSDNIDEIIGYFENFEKNFSYKTKRVAEKSIEQLMSAIEYEIQSGTDEYFKGIEVESDDSNIGFKFDSHIQLEMTEDLFTIGLDKMDERSKAIEKEIAEIEESIAEKNEEVMKSRRALRKLNELKTEKEKLDLNRDYIESRVMPDVEYVDKEEVVKEYRGGLLGIIGNILMGAKKRTKVVRVKDDSRYKEALKRQMEELEKSNKKEEEIKQKMDFITGLDNPDMLELYESQRQEQEDKLVQKKEELSEEIKRKIVEIKTKTKKNIRNIQRKLEDACEDMIEDAEQQIKSELKKRESVFAEVISANIESRIKAGLAKETARLEKLMEQLNASEKDKNERLDILHKKDEKIKELLSDVIDLHSEIYNIQVDSILD